MVNHASDLATVSSLEATGLLVVLVAAALLYYRFSAVPVAVMGATVSGRLDDPPSTRRACGPDCVVCPHCGVENATSYRYCRRCAGLLHRR